MSCWQGRWDEPLGSPGAQAAGSLGSQAVSSGQVLLPSVKWWRASLGSSWSLKSTRLMVKVFLVFLSQGSLCSLGNPGYTL